MGLREYAFQEESPAGWITRSRHATASAAADAAFGEGANLGVRRRVVGVVETSVVRIGVPDEREFHPTGVGGNVVETYEPEPAESADG